MTFKEKYNQTLHWLPKITTINLYHQMMIAHKNHWTIRGTAEYFGVSIGLVSENLRLAERIDEVKGCNSRKEALLKINGTK